jgi:hypothetical protein
VLGVLLLSLGLAAGYVYNGALRLGHTVIIGPGFSGTAHLGGGVRVDAEWHGQWHGGSRQVLVSTSLSRHGFAYYSPMTLPASDRHPLGIRRVAGAFGEFSAHQWNDLVVVQIDPRWLRHRATPVAP